MAMAAQKEQWLQQATAHLVDGEQIIDSTTGRIPFNGFLGPNWKVGLVLITDRRVVLYAPKTPKGYFLTDITYDLLAGLDYRNGMMAGNLTLNASGDATVVQWIPKAEVERVAQAIRSQKGSFRNGTTPPPSPQADLSSEIRKIASLRDDGLITDSEFEAKKKQPLGL